MQTPVWIKRSPCEVFNWEGNKEKIHSGLLVMAVWLTSAKYILEIKSFNQEPSRSFQLKGS